MEKLKESLNLKIRGKNEKHIFFLVLILLMVVSLSCSKKVEVIEIKNYPLDNMDGLITMDNVMVDKENSFDGKGSLKVTVQEPTVVRLFETGKLNIENAKMIYRAKLKCENLEGQAFLELWCAFNGKGEFFGRGLQSAVSGNLNWLTSEAYFFLEKGQNPDNIKLNLVVNGKGTVWIDDIKLIRAPLK